VRTSDFDYELPADRIAQRPKSPRDSARLLVYDRKSGQIEHRIFHELLEYLSDEDIIVINETRVIRARLRAVKVPSGGAAEIFLLKRLSNKKWEVIVGGKGIKRGSQLQISGGPRAEVLDELEGARRVISFDEPITHQLAQIGEMPVPPYIHTPLRDPDEYQTVYASADGSVAAPTAGLHFTPGLLRRIEKQKIGLAKISLHIGLDTFAPVKLDDPEKHPIHQEWCQVTAEAAESVNLSRGRVIAVGTTSVRTLETAAMNTQSPERVRPYEGETNLFILPGYQFQAVDALITNFHLPQTTLLMMISAFTGREQLLNIYTEAIQKNYRFYSFGDAMLIL
jgi:S-adenosylmethionine:tRNA ribosyltransferase-isomerase